MPRWQLVAHSPRRPPPPPPPLPLRQWHPRRKLDRLRPRCPHKPLWRPTLSGNRNHPRVPRRPLPPIQRLRHCPLRLLVCQLSPASQVLQFRRRTIRSPRARIPAPPELPRCSPPRVAKPGRLGYGTGYRTSSTRTIRQVGSVRPRRAVRMAAFREWMWEPRRRTARRRNRRAEPRSRRPEGPRKPRARSCRLGLSRAWIASTRSPARWPRNPPRAAVAKSRTRRPSERPRSEHGY